MGVGCGGRGKAHCGVQGLRWGEPAVWGAGRGWWRALSSPSALSVLSTLPPINVLLKAGAPGGTQLSWRGQIHAGGADCLFPGSRWHVFNAD